MPTANIYKIRIQYGHIQKQDLHLLKKIYLKTDKYQYLRCSRYQFITEVLCFTDIERQNLHDRLISASLRLTGELIIMLLYDIYLKLH